MLNFRRCRTALACALALSGVLTAQAATAAGDKPVAGRSFDIYAYDVDGNTLLDQDAVERAVYPFLGPDRTREDVEGARRNLEEYYHVRGYDSVVVEVPSQDVSNHLVRLHVVEAPVGHVKVTGERYYSPEDIKKGAPAIAEGQTPNFQQAQAEINDLNRLPGRQVSPVVLPGKVPGTVDIELKVVDQEPLQASVQLTNDHSPNTRPLRLTGNVHYDNLWQMGHSLSFTYAVAPQDRSQSEVFAGSYLAPVPDSRWSLLAYGYTSASNVATLGDITVLGKGYAAGLRGIAQLQPIGQVSQSVSLGGDFKHFDQLVNTSSTTVTSSASAIDYVPLTLVYSIQAETPAQSLHASLGLTAGVRASRGDEAVFQVNRAYAHANFVHFNLEADDTLRLPYGAALNLRVAGQISDAPLVSGEQFAVGGLSSVRGYLQAVAIGDNGVAGTVELRSPAIRLAPRRLLDDWRVFAFSDAGDTWLIQPLPGQTGETPLYSFGAGTRFQLLGHLDGDVAVAFPMRSTASSVARRAYTVFSLKAGF
jgi:hemolysin activation/secretion protein